MAVKLADARRASWASGLVTLFVGLAIGCGSSSSGGGFLSAGTAPGSTAPGSTSSFARTAADVKVSGPLLRGDVAIAFTLVDPAAAAADIEVDYSLDGGQTWSPASAASGSASSALSSGPTPGADHAWVWDSGADVNTFESGVNVRVTLVGGGSASTAAGFALDNEPVTSPVVLNRRPFLQATTTTETLVLWRTETNAPTIVEYGTTPSLGLVAGDPQASTKDHQARLIGLSAGAPAYYRIVVGGLPLTQRIAFEAAPSASTDRFQFLVVGDSGMGNPEQRTLAALMAAEPDVDLYLNTGDVIYPAGGLGAVVAEYNARFFEPYQDLLERVPAFPVIGNHDLLGLLGQPFKDTFVLPDNGAGALLNELYFAFEWGDCKFIALESTALFMAPIGQHITWLNNELTNHSKKWVIVYMHAPLYSCGVHGDNPILQFSIGSILERGGVDLVLTGHDHNYERTVPIKAYNHDPSYPGLVHIVSGGGGAGLRSIHPNARTDVALSEHHYLKVRIDGDWLYGDAIGLQGQTIDSFALQNH